MPIKFKVMDLLMKNYRSMLRETLKVMTRKFNFSYTLKIY